MATLIVAGYYDNKIMLFDAFTGERFTRPGFWNLPGYVPAKLHAVGREMFFFTAKGHKGLWMTHADASAPIQLDLCDNYSSGASNLWQTWDVASAGNLIVATQLLGQVVTWQLRDHYGFRRPSLDIALRLPHKQLYPQLNTVTAVRLLRDSERMVIADAVGQIVIACPMTGNIYQVIDDQAGKVTALTEIPGVGLGAQFGNTGVFTVWDLDTGTELGTINYYDETKNVGTLCKEYATIVTDDVYFLVEGLNGVQQFSLTTQQVVAEYNHPLLSPDRYLVNWMWASPDGQYLLVATRSNDLLLFSIRSTKCINVLGSSEHELGSFVKFSVCEYVS